MGDRLAGKVAVVTGGTSGIGRSIVERFAAEGAAVVFSGRRAALGAEIARATGAVFVEADVAREADAERTVKRAADAHGRLDALVNNAAVSPKGKNGARLGAIDTPFDLWRQVFNVNFFAPVALARGLVDELSAAQGAVVNVTSIAGSRVHPFAGSAYATSKAALAALTREMAHDFGPRGIRVNAIAPGEIDTAILSPGTNKIVEEQIPMRRLGTPDEVADVIHFLCEKGASYVSGAEIQINGGQHV